MAVVVVKQLNTGDGAKPRLNGTRQMANVTVSFTGSTAYTTGGMTLPTDELQNVAGFTYITNFTPLSVRSGDDPQDVTNVKEITVQWDEEDQTLRIYKSLATTSWAELDNATLIGDSVSGRLQVDALIEGPDAGI